MSGIKEELEGIDRSSGAHWFPVYREANRDGVHLSKTKIRFTSGERRVVELAGGDGCTTVWMEMPPTQRLGQIKVIHSILCAFYHSENSGEILSTVTEHPLGRGRARGVMSWVCRFWGKLLIGWQWGCSDRGG